MTRSRFLPLLAGLSLSTLGTAACGNSDTAGSGAAAGSTTSTETGGTGGTATTSTSTESGGTGGTTGTAGTAGSTTFAGNTQVDKGQANGVSGSADVAIAPDGTIYVVWVAEQNGGRDVLVARSTDGGETFGPAVQLDDAAIVPLVSMARHPYVVASDDRVAVTFNDEAGVVYLYISSATGSLDFGAPTFIGTDVTTDFRDFPKPIFLSDNSLLVAWHGYPVTGARVFVSRESTGFTSEEATGGAPGVPCECCPIDLAVNGGSEMLAFRNNDSNIREMWLAKAPSGGPFDGWAAISTSEGLVPTCPMQGPRLAQIGPTELLSVWSVRGDSNTGKVYASRSTDGGDTWSGGAPVGSFTGDEPTIGVGPTGDVFVTGVTGSNTASIVISTDGGKTWSAPEQITVPDGTIRVPQAEGSGGVAALAGVSTAGSVWLVRMQ